MTLTTTEKESELSMLLGLIKRKEDWVKEGKEIDKLFSLYATELAEAKKHLHKQADGKLITVHDMDDDHLYNTIALNVRKKGFNGIPDKYKVEMKKRPDVLKRVLEMDITVDGSGEDEEDNGPMISDKQRYFEEVRLRKSGQYSMMNSEYSALRSRYGNGPRVEYFNNFDPRY